MCTDLDRTLLPNGPEPESANARKNFNRLVQHPQVTLVYVTGRHQQLVKQAIDEYQLPQADYVIADVGSTIYEIKGHDWHYQQQWERFIEQDWQGKNANQLHSLLVDLEGLKRQEESKQNTHKLSYYVTLKHDHQKIIAAMQNLLQQQSIKANLIWSVDQLANTGLLDVLPASAGKRQAIEFLMQQLKFDYSDTVFAGDSGNDIGVMSSQIQSILVANAEEDVRHEAVRQAQLNHQQSSLYLAQGNFMDMNGNYSAGILEGVVHYIPQAENWIRGEK
ncbi:MAG: HAD-IIB family hydrolase [Gammaproteobacteria bacterium]|nr:HAD-IIB family hydrolase [Gammaproteobacteria bacterium]